MEVEKERALELQKREKELREKLLGNLLKKSSEKAARAPSAEEPGAVKEEAGGSDVRLGVLGQENRVTAIRSREKQEPKSGVSGRSRGAGDKRDDGVRSRRSAEQVTHRDRSHRERSSQSRAGRRRRRSPSRRRRSASHHRTSSYHRRSYSHHSNRRRSHSRGSRSTSSSRERSRSSRGRSYSRGRSHRCSYRRHSRGSSRSSSRSRSRYRRSDSHDRRRYRRSRDRR